MWPRFEHRYIPELQAEAPAYLDVLLLSLFLLLVISASLYSLSHRYRNVYRSFWHRAFRLFSSLQTLYLIGVSAALLIVPHGVDEHTTGYWQVVGVVILITLLLLALTLLIDTWLLYTFLPTKEVPRWYAIFFRAWSLLSYLLYPIIALVLFTSLGQTTLFVLFLGAYILFRLYLLVQTFRLFPQLTRYPFHIILYLCTCEILPLAFAFKGA